MMIDKNKTFYDDYWATYLFSHVLKETYLNNGQKKETKDIKDKKAILAGQKTKHFCLFCKHLLHSSTVNRPIHHKS